MYPARLLAGIGALLISLIGEGAAVRLTGVTNVDTVTLDAVAITVVEAGIDEVAVIVLINISLELFEFWQKSAADEADKGLVYTMLFTGETSTIRSLSSLFSTIIVLCSVAVRETNERLNGVLGMPITVIVDELDAPNPIELV